MRDYLESVQMGHPINKVSDILNAILYRIRTLLIHRQPNLPKMFFILLNFLVEKKKKNLINLRVAAQQLSIYLRA